VPHVNALWFVHTPLQKQHLVQSLYGTWHQAQGPLLQMLAALPLQTWVLNTAAGADAAPISNKSVTTTPVMQTKKTAGLSYSIKPHHSASRKQTSTTWLKKHEQNVQPALEQERMH
jgi:hypothetical protein